MNAEQALAEALEAVEHPDRTQGPRFTPTFYGWTEYGICDPADLAPLVIDQLRERGFDVMLIPVPTQAGR